MPRMPRVVIPDVAHHVTQRGSRSLPTFFRESDYLTYRTWITESCHSAGVSVLAYCLMPNHVHLIMVPSEPDGLRRALAEAHRRYAKTINQREGWRGHLWQERFHSFPLDDHHLINAVRYIELNPVRAGLVTQPENWRWSSAVTRVSGGDDPLLSRCSPLPLQAIASWGNFLAEGLAPDEAARLRQHEQSGRPLGNDRFITELECRSGRKLRPMQAGRRSA